MCKETRSEMLTVLDETVMCIAACRNEIDLPALLLLADSSHWLTAWQAQRQLENYDRDLAFSFGRMQAARGLRSNSYSDFNEIYGVQLTALKPHCYACGALEPSTEHKICGDYPLHLCADACAPASFPLFIDADTIIYRLNHIAYNNEWFQILDQAIRDHATLLHNAISPEKLSVRIDVVRDRPIEMADFLANTLRRPLMFAQGCLICGEPDTILCESAVRDEPSPICRKPCSALRACIGDSDIQNRRTYLALMEGSHDSPLAQKIGHCEYVETFGKYLKPAVPLEFNDACAACGEKERPLTVYVTCTLCYDRCANREPGTLQRLKSLIVHENCDFVTDHANYLLQASIADSLLQDGNKICLTLYVASLRTRIPVCLACGETRRSRLTRLANFHEAYYRTLFWMDENPAPMTHSVICMRACEGAHPAKIEMLKYLCEVRHIVCDEDYEIVAPIQQQAFTLLAQLDPYHAQLVIDQRENDQSGSVVSVLGTGWEPNLIPLAPSESAHPRP